MGSGFGCCITDDGRVLFPMNNSELSKEIVLGVECTAFSDCSCETSERKSCFFFFPKQMPPVAVGLFCKKEIYLTVR